LDFCIKTGNPEAGSSEFSLIIKEEGTNKKIGYSLKQN